MAASVCGRLAISTIENGRDRFDKVWKMQYGLGNAAADCGSPNGFALGNGLVDGMKPSKHSYGSSGSKRGRQMPGYRHSLPVSKADYSGRQLESEVRGKGWNWRGTEV